MMSDSDRFVVVLNDVGSKKIDIIKVVRSLTNLDLKAAKDLVEAAPQAVLEDVSREIANHAKEQLEAFGARVLLQPFRKRSLRIVSTPDKVGVQSAMPTQMSRVVISDSAVVITDDLAQLIDTHNRLWEQYDTSTAHAGKLRELADRFPNYNSAPPLTPLTSENTPATELAAALTFVQRELESANKINSAIDARREQIRQIKSQAQLILIGLIILGLIVLVAGGAFVLSLFN
jgi:hypothetical protein